MLRLSLLAAVVLALAPGTGADAASCSPPVSGGTAGEQTAARQVLCNMRGTTIEGVRILGNVPNAPPDALWLAIAVPRATASSADLLTYVRAKWEANVAAGGIRDRFARVGYPKVFGYEELFDGDQPDSRYLYGIALPAWGASHWATGGRPNPKGGHVETWTQLQVKLDALSRRFGVRTRLERYEPFGKAPLVTVLTSRPTAFIDAGGFTAYRRALHFGSAYFDGVLLRVVTPGLTGVQVEAVYRGRPVGGCALAGHVKHAGKVCQAD